LLSICSWQLFAQAHEGAAPESNSYFWRQAVGGAVMGQPAVHGQSVTMVLDGGNLRAHSISGRPLWNFSARGRLSPFLTRSRDGVSYIGRTNGTLIAVNGSGREIWRANLGGELSAAPVLGRDGRVFAPTARRVACFTASGTLLWRRDFDSGIVAGPWPDQSGGALLALESGCAVRIDPFGNVTRWGMPSAPSIMVSVMRPDSGSLAGESPAIIALRQCGEVSLLDPSRPCAEPAGIARLSAAPVAAVGRGDRAAVLLPCGQTLMLSSGGEVLWSGSSHFRAGPAGGVSLVYDVRGVYVLSQDGATGFSESGEILWLAGLRNVSGIPALCASGALLAGGQNWIFYSWRLEGAASVDMEAQGRRAEEAYVVVGYVSPSAFAGSPLRLSENMVRRELDAIQRAIAQGNVGENEPEWISFLKETAQGGMWPPGSPPNAQPRASVASRVRALQLLSRIGSGSNVPWLAHFFGREPNPAVRAAAALAIGGIGFDPGGRALGEFAAAATPGNPGRDEQVLLSVAAATGALCRVYGPAAYEQGVRVLVMLSGANQPLSVQRQARLELESLMPAL